MHFGPITILTDIFRGFFFTCQKTAVAVLFCRALPPLKDCDLLNSDANFPFSFDKTFALFM